LKPLNKNTFRDLNTNVLVTAVHQEHLQELMFPLTLQPSKPYLESYLLPIIQLLLSVDILLGQLGVKFNDGPYNIRNLFQLSFSPFYIKG
jgi:hypothetical protein